MDGQKIRDAREELGWSRGDLIANLDPDTRVLTIAKLANIELGNRDPNEDEETELKRVLRGQLHQTLTESGEHSAITIEDDADGTESVSIKLSQNGVEATRYFSWKGLKQGDYCRVRGARGKFRFMYYHVDETQAYVEVYGPMNKPGERSFDPSRVRRR